MRAQAAAVAQTVASVTRPTATANLCPWSMQTTTARLQEAVVSKTARAGPDGAAKSAATKQTAVKAPAGAASRIDPTSRADRHKRRMPSIGCSQGGFSLGHGPNARSTLGVEKTPVNDTLHVTLSES
jgi:hypothetical protein